MLIISVEMDNNFIGTSLVAATTNGKEMRDDYLDGMQNLIYIDAYNIWLYVHSTCNI